MRQIISKSNLRFFLIPILILLIFVRCDEDETSFPYVYVNATIYLNELNLGIGEHDYVEGYGVGGLIIYQKGINEYLAFDAACTYEASSNCKLQDGTTFTNILECSCCGSKFWMTGEDMEGWPSNGPANVPLKEYKCFFNDANTLRITN
ncbi:MAG: hypothetical protein K8R31_12075 [Bacteroidales bacterium]|nr:hypothetical protein [Bacteroidales bacterium]